MLRSVRKLNYKTKYELLSQAQQALDSWEEQGTPEVVWEDYRHVCRLHNEDETELVLYRCGCGEYIADFEDYSGRDIDSDRCHVCNAPYDYSERELSQL